MSKKDESDYSVVPDGEAPSKSDGRDDSRGVSADETTSTQHSSPVRSMAIEKWWTVQWYPSTLDLLVCQLVATLVLQSFLFLSDLVRYAVDIPTALTDLFWFLSLMFTIVATAGVLAAIAKNDELERSSERGVLPRPRTTRKSKRRTNKKQVELVTWWQAPTMISQALLLLTVLYICWVDATSLYWNPSKLIIPVLMGANAIYFLLPLSARLTQLQGKAWAAALAAVSALGVSQFVLENQILPNRSSPNIQIVTHLSVAGRSSGLIFLKATVDVSNDGKATATLVTSDVELRNVGNSGSAPSRVVSLPATALSGVDPVAPEAPVYQRQLSGGERGVVWVTQLFVIGEFVLPGQKLHREYLISEHDSAYQEYELRASIVALTHLRPGTEHVNTCDKLRAVEDPGFVVDSTRANNYTDGSQRTCLRWAIEPRNTIRSWFDDQPVIYFGYVLGPGSDADVAVGPWASYGSMSRGPGTMRGDNPADRENPSAIDFATNTLFVSATGK